MKRFLIISGILAVTCVALWADFVPVRCSHCDRILFRTDITSTLFGGHGEVLDLRAPEHRPTTALALGDAKESSEATASDSRG